MQPLSEIEAVQAAVAALHGCCAKPVQTAPVREAFQGQPVWEGVVHVFDLEGHPKATRAYAWSSPIEESEKRRFYAVPQWSAAPSRRRRNQTNQGQETDTPPMTPAWPGTLARPFRIVSGVQHLLYVLAVMDRRYPHPRQTVL